MRRTGRTPFRVIGVHARARVNVDIPDRRPPRPPAGFYPISEMYKHAVVAGCALLCLACGAEAKTMLPRQLGYSGAVEGFLQEHRDCGRGAA